jgi:hypothetical protein
MRDHVAYSRRPMLVVTLVLSCASAGACTSASGEVRGGDARPGYDASAPDPLVVPINEPTYEDAGDTTWRGIYRDFFGRHSPASCAGNGTCHDAAGKPGASDEGFVCGDVDGCWDSLRHAMNPDPAKKTRSLVDDASLANPDDAHLFEVIRFRTADGVIHENKGMPRAPREYIFSPGEIDRMKAWIRSGANND